MTNWQTKKLEDLTLKGGLVRGPFGGALKKEIFKPSGFKVYEQRNAIYGTTELGDYYIDEDKYNKLKRFSVNEGDFIVSCSGTIGRIFKIPEGAPLGVINQALLKITIDKDVVLPEYFHQYFKWDRFQSEVIDNTQGGAMQNLVGMDIFRSTKLQIPEKPEQERIVGVLEVWDEYIEKLEQKIALKEQLKKGLMQQLLTGKHRLPSFSEKWIVRKMGEFAKESRVKEGDNDVHKRLTVRLHLKGVEARGVRGTEAVDSTQYYRRSAGQLIYGKQNIFKGSIGVVPALYDGYASSQDIPSFDIEEAVANVYYIYYYLSRKSIYEWLENFAGGSGSKRLHTSEFYNIKIQLPSLEEQGAIVEVLQLALKEIESLKKHRDVLTKQKKYLLKNLITGTIRTPEDLQPLDTSRLERSAL